ncbi:hypothetical protein H2200_010150 [Cladophialophora chaetospira]|uniref:N-acetyltransferase domain-containing protein n=1 Tax=Cladophialophora chaetospira TaxID=386627 RepID=A0AA38X297_9EURO|nr:hypothetical protein H2200_010150 [Cladophialophora chaetospira]
MSHVAHSITPPRTWARDGFLVSTDTTLIPIDALNKAFGSEAIYWASSLPEPAMREMLDNCLCFGLYSPTPAPPQSTHLGEDAISASTPPEAAETLHEIAGHVKPETSTQTTTAPSQLSNAVQQSQDQDRPSLIGFARLITDRVTFAYLTDVYTLPEWQGQGLGKWLISCVQDAVEDMPYLRRSLCIVGHSKDKGTDFYGKLMKMKPVEPPVTILSWKGPGNTF